MDFSLDEAQQSAHDAAVNLFKARCTEERLREVEASHDGIDRELWAELAKADLLSLAIPEEHGGSGLGLMEVAIVLEAAANAAAPVPLVPTLIGALAITRFGSPELRAEILPKIADGSAIVALGLADTGTIDSDGFLLTGSRSCIPGLPVAQYAVVSTDDQLFVVRLPSEGATVTPLATTAASCEGRLELLNTPAVELAGGPEAVAWVEQRAIAAMCAQMAGLCEAALRLTAEYTKTRIQFDRPIATFQAAGHRQADAYIDTEAVRLTARQAAWRLGASADATADEQVAIAKFWAAEGGQRVVHAAAHLHGGIGVDRDYPLHRFFLRAKELELSLGGATRSLLRLGKFLADTPV